MEQLKENYEENCNKTASLILLICYLVTLILIIIWLFKLHNNARSEPKYRNRYIINDPSTSYTEEEFCYENYQSFIVSGALKKFDIPTEKIRKFCKGLIGTIFISIGSFILSSIFFGIYKADKSRTTFMALHGLFYVLFFLGLILSIVFGIILMHYYSKGNYNDFEEFSRCKYLSKKFRKDYDFINKLKNEYKMPFAVIILTEFFNFIKLIIEIGQKNDKSKNKEDDSSKTISNITPVHKF